MATLETQLEEKTKNKVLTIIRSRWLMMVEFSGTD